jgi:RNA polymerase sigma factor (sigma-70 family)
MRASPKGSVPLDDEGRRKVEQHMGIAFAVLKETNAGANMHPDDRRQVAVMGLIRAVQYYDEGRGVSFGTYAWSSIRNHLSAAGRRDRIIPLGRAAERRADLPESSRKAAERAAKVVSLDGEDGRQIPVAARPGPSERADLLAAVLGVINGLPPRLRTTILMRMDGVSYLRISEETGVTYQYAQYDERRAVKAIRRMLSVTEPAPRRKVGWSDSLTSRA